MPRVLRAVTRAPGAAGSENSRYVTDAPERVEAMLARIMNEAAR